MPIKVTSSNADVCDETGRRYVAEASTLQIAPGEWPVSLETDLGNGKPFLSWSWVVQEGMLYLQQDNADLKLTVVND